MTLKYVSIDHDRLPAPCLSLPFLPSGEYGYGRTTAHIYLISKPSAEIAEEIAAGVRSGVFPSVEMVNNTLHKPPPTPRYNGTTGTTEETIPVVPDQNCTAYTVVPEGMPPPEREFFVRKIEEIDESAQRKNDDSEGAL